MERNIIMALPFGDLFATIEMRLAESSRSSLFDLAHQLAVDRHSIEKAIRAHKNISFREYKHQIHIEELFRLLSTQAGLSRKEAAWILGYESPSAFSRFLRAKTSKTFSEIKADMRVSEINARHGTQSQ
jgi:methylphosphotriester-DNA--protein-cysteine methyltransferase